jgi:hypothetical protein
LGEIQSEEEEIQNSIPPGAINDNPTPTVVSQAEGTLTAFISYLKTLFNETPVAVISDQLRLPIIAYQDELNIITAYKGELNIIANSVKFNPLVGTGSVGVNARGLWATAHSTAVKLCAGGTKAIRGVVAVVSDGFVSCHLPKVVIYVNYSSGSRKTETITVYGAGDIVGWDDAGLPLPNNLFVAYEPGQPITGITTVPGAPNSCSVQPKSYV